MSVHPPDPLTRAARLHRGWRLAAVVALAMTVLALVLAAVALTRPTPVHIEPEATFALPPPASACDGATGLPGGGDRIPLTVSTVSGQVAESLNVCIGGQGPFPFVLDTGAGHSIIDTGLARRLGLASAGPASEFAGVGCTGTAHPVSVGSWSLDGVTLRPQQLTAATLPHMGGKGQLVGLLGSDVLARFGAVRVDFRAGALVLPGPEGDQLGGVTPVTGPTAAPPTSLTGGAGTAVPATVTAAEGDVSLGVAVRFAGGAPRQFVVDTGSSQSIVSTSAAQAASLAGTDLAQRQPTVCSVITVPLVQSGPWAVPGVSLHRQFLGSTEFGSVGSSGIQGLLGSDQLKRYRWIVLDYVGAQIVLG